ncbi:MAG TPA: thermonuclease family protein [Steroidobacteraceae bacterium]
MTRLRALPVLIARWIVLVLAAWATLACAAGTDQRDFSGIVIRVFDGDSFIVRATSKPHAGRNIEVRLMDVDAPEKDQPYADHSRAALIELIDGREVFVDVVETDQFKRKIARVFREPDRLDITRALVAGGHVWVNRRYAEDRSLAALEDRAREERQGMWALPRSELVPPWQFRRERRRNQQQASPRSAAEQPQAAP